MKVVRVFRRGPGNYDNNEAKDDGEIRRICHFLLGSQLLGESLNIHLAFQERGYMCASLRSRANLMIWIYLDTTERIFQELLKLGAIDEWGITQTDNVSPIPNNTVGPDLVRVGLMLTHFDLLLDLFVVAWVP